MALLRAADRRDGACADLPCPILYRQAAAAFPEARFVVVERSPAKWLDSVRRHMAGRDFCVLERMAYWWLTGMRRPRLGDYEESVLLAAYRTHTARALDTFRELGVAHAVLSLEAPDFAARIADFCGFARERQFPHVDYLPAKEAAARRAMGAK